MTSRRVDRLNFGTHRLTSFQVRVLRDGQSCVALRGLRAARDERLSLGRAFQWPLGGTTKDETLRSLFLLPRSRWLLAAGVQPVSSRHPRGFQERFLYELV
jgi:hypothetical protein